MLIHCPHCGPRDLAEFTYIGDATRPRPALDAPRAAWCAYLYERSNPMGRHLEHWQHTAGCRAILVVERDTLTHEIHGVRLAGPWADTPADAPTVAEPAE